MGRIPHNEQALRIENSTVTVEDVLIENNFHAFVPVNNSTVTFRNGQVKSNERNGVYASDSVVDFFNSLFENNGLDDVGSIHGIYAKSGSDIYLGSRSFSSDPNVAGGFNTIRYNHGAGILIKGGAYLTAGMVYSGTYAAGKNSMHGNGTISGTYAGKDFYNESDFMFAENNYLGRDLSAISITNLWAGYNELLSWQFSNRFITDSGRCSSRPAN